MTSQRFIKFIPSEKSNFLRSKYPYAFLLLSLIAERARRTSGHIDGLTIGDAIIGDYKSAGLTRQQYRTAIDKLVELGIIEVIYNGKKFSRIEKSTIKATIKGMLVKLLDSSIWDINSEDSNQHINQRATINKNEKKEIQEEESLIDCCNDGKIVPLAFDDSDDFADSSISPISDFSILSNEVTEISVFCNENELLIMDQTIDIWVKKGHSKKYILDHLELLISGKQIANPSAWMETALKKDYISINKNAKANRDLCIMARDKLGMSDLNITQRYVSILGNPGFGDLPFCLPFQTFKEKLYNEYKNRKKVNDGNHTL